MRSRSHADLWAGLDERREVLNQHLPSRALSHQAPLEAYPQAIHSGRSYRPEWEEELLSLEKVCSYLAQGRWFRRIRSNGFFGLGSYQYYLGKPFAQRSVAIGFDPDTMSLICQLEGSEQTIRLPVQGITKAELVGELAALRVWPIHQLAPYSRWRPGVSLRTLTAWLARLCETLPKRGRYDFLRLDTYIMGTTPLVIFQTY